MCVLFTINVYFFNLFEIFNFFSDIKLEVKDNVLILTVVENKIIQQIQVKGIKAKKPTKNRTELKTYGPINSIPVS